MTLKMPIRVSMATCLRCLRKAGARDCVKNKESLLALWSELMHFQDEIIST